MIDELAKALCENAGWRWGRHPVLDERYRRRVRTVLRRLREPTDAMLAAGTAAITGGPEPDPDYAADTEAMYRAMIDAALGERGA